MTTESLRSFATRLGNAPSHVHKMKTHGRLVMVNVGGKELVDVEASLERIAATSDPARAYMTEVNQTQRVMHRGTVAPPALPQGTSQHGTTADSKNATYMQAKTADMVYTAKTAQLEYEERIGKLMRADEVKSYQAGKIASLREAFLQIPSRLVPVLAAETDPAKIHVLLEDEIVRAMALVSGEMTNGRA